MLSGDGIVPERVAIPQQRGHARRDFENVTVPDFASPATASSRPSEKLEADFAGNVNGSGHHFGNSVR